MFNLDDSTLTITFGGPDLDFPTGQGLDADALRVRLDSLLNPTIQMESGSVTGPHTWVLSSVGTAGLSVDDLLTVVWNGGGGGDAPTYAGGTPVPAFTFSPITLV